MAAPYAEVPGDGRSPLTLPIITIEPADAESSGYARCDTSSGAVRLSSMILACRRGDVPASGAPGEPPALLTTRSSRPYSRSISPSRPSTSPGSRTSAARYRAWRNGPVPPRSRPSGSRGIRSGGLRAQTTTSAPAPRKAEAMPAPMPLLPPVTSTTLPV